MNKRTKNPNVEISEADLHELAKTSPALREILQLNSERVKTKKDKTDFVRVQLDFPLVRIQELNQAMKDADLGTRKDLFNNALTLFVWAISEKMKGHGIFSVDEDQLQKELVMMPLEHAANKARRSRAGSPPPDSGIGDEGGGGEEDEEE